ncbi:hypothetical protein C8D70_10235 [Chryseobacterium sp. CBTAP 102]|nr:hypothetical protein C8D70_10235 [Chryseobacterium sp. CBTAP 102]
MKIFFKNINCNRTYSLSSGIMLHTKTHAKRDCNNRKNKKEAVSKVKQSGFCHSDEGIISLITKYMRFFTTFHFVQNDTFETASCFILFILCRIWRAFYLPKPLQRGRMQTIRQRQNLHHPNYKFFWQEGRVKGKA